MRLRREGTHVRSGLLSCTMVIDSSCSGPYVGYALGRSFGSAVRRNRLRRQLRVLVKEREAMLPPGILVFGGSSRACELSFASLGLQFDRLVATIARRAESARP